MSEKPTARQFLRFSYSFEISVDGYDQLPVGKVAHERSIVFRYNDAAATGCLAVVPKMSAKGGPEMALKFRFVTYLRRDRPFVFSVKWESRDSSTKYLSREFIPVIWNIIWNESWYRSERQSPGRNMEEIRQKGFVLDEHRMIAHVKFDLSKDLFRLEDILRKRVGCVSRPTGNLGKALYAEIAETTETDYGDLELRSKEDDTRIRCHKVILAHRSEYFRGAFRFEGSSKQEVGWSGEVLKEIVYFIYHDEVSEKFGDVPVEAILDAANMCFLEKLKLLCEQRLLVQFKERKAWDNLRIAHLYDLKYLKNRAMVLASRDENCYRAHTEVAPIGEKGTKWNCSGTPLANQTGVLNRELINFMMKENTKYMKTIYLG